MISSTPWSVSPDAAETGLVTLPPGFLDALRKVVPRRRRPKLPYIVGLGLLTVVGVLGADRSTRELVATRWHQAPPGVLTSTAAARVVMPAPSASDIETPSAMTAEPAALPFAPVNSSTTSASEPVGPQNRTHTHRSTPRTVKKQTSAGPAPSAAVRGGS